MPTSTLRVSWLRWLLSLLLLTGALSASANKLQPLATLSFVNPSPPEGQHITISANSPFSFPVKAQSTDTQAVLTLSAANPPAGATLATTTGMGTVQAAFSYLPTPNVDAIVPVAFIVSSSNGEKLTLNIVFEVHSYLRPVFIAPTPPSHQVFNLTAGTPFSFTVKAYAPQALFGFTSLTIARTPSFPKGATVSSDIAGGNHNTPAQITFTWTPTTADVGTYSIYFEAQGDGGSLNGTGVTLVVGLGACDPALTKPVANDDVLATTSGSAVTFTKSQLLANDTSPQGQALQVTAVGQPKRGKLTTNADGSYTYAPFGTYTGRDTISYLVQPTGVVLASPATGHYYEFVSAPGICWSTAKASVGNRTYNGMQGYLATVTSEAENAFLTGRMPGHYWLGGSDAGVEGEWHWKTGPDTDLLFWQGAAAGTAVRYSHWSPGEPNDYQNQYRPQGEDYAEFYGASGYWNDLDNCHTGDVIDGYLVEYGGLESCTPQLYATGRLIITIGAGTPARTTAAPAAALAAGPNPAALSVAPNPSNGQFSVQFTASAAGPCRLELLDMQGRRVRTLLDAPLQAGENRALDVNAAELATGLYLVRLQNAALVQTLRLSVVR